MDDPDERRLTHVTDPDRDLLACMRGEHGPAWYMLAWAGGLALPTLIVLGLISVVVAE